MDFYELFINALKSSGLSNTEFGSKVGASKQHVTDMVKRRRTPPLDRMNAWAHALGLVEGSPEWDEFHLEAQLAHSPEALRPFVRHLISELATLKEGNVNLSDKIGSLMDENACLRTQLEQHGGSAAQIFGNTPDGGSQGPGGGRISRGKPPGGAGAPDHA